MTPIQIVPHDPAWPERGQQTGRNLDEFLAGTLLPEVNPFEVAGGEAPARS